MRRLELGPLVALMFMSFTGTALAQQDSPLEETGGRRIEVGGESTEPPIVIIRPGFSTTLLFSAALARDGVDLEGRESFKWVEIGERGISLVPSASLRPGTRLRLTVRFEDDTDPSGAVFHLEVSSSRVERQVEIDRLPLSCERCAKQLREAKEETRQCHEAFQQGRLVACETEGLTGLLAAGLMDGRGIRSSARKVGQFPKHPRRWIQVVSFRSSQRVAVWLEVEFPEGDEPLMRPAQVKLLDQQGKPLGTSRAWSFTSPSTRKSTFVLELNAGPNEALGGYSVMLWEADGTHTTLMGNMRFPDLAN